MPPVGLEPTVSAGERPQSYTLDRTATGTATWNVQTTGDARFLIELKCLQFCRFPNTNLETL